jgi:hypothetical protein
MASYSVLRGKHATAGAGVADAITFTASGREIRVRNRGATNSMYVTVNGDAPVAAADDTYFVGPSENVVITTMGKVVKLISTAGTDYTVELY